MCLHFQRKTMAKTTLVYGSPDFHPFIRLYWVMLFSIEHCYCYDSNLENSIMPFNFKLTWFPNCMIYSVFWRNTPSFHSWTVNIEQYQVLSLGTHLLSGMLNECWQEYGIRKAKLDAWYWWLYDAMMKCYYSDTELKDTDEFSLLLSLPLPFALSVIAVLCLCFHSSDSLIQWYKSKQCGFH